MYVCMYLFTINVYYNVNTNENERGKNHMKVKQQNY